ncbi:unnamed protein product [Effrenium voratum]|uniref:Uncharacterized protein n=1 Tax=Effrenium voratum TaxID=2562239 RepID=A0AA36JHK4_9DINO|nr:unnamed protein product [Effrenium voratum]
MSRSAAQKIQGLREMLQLVFRLFCSDSDGFAKLMADGEVGSTILDLVAKMIQAEGPENMRERQRAGALALNGWGLS